MLLDIVLPYVAFRVQVPPALCMSIDQSVSQSVSQSISGKMAHGTENTEIHDRHGIEQHFSIFVEIATIRLWSLWAIDLVLFSYKGCSWNFQFSLQAAEPRWQKQGIVLKADVRMLRIAQSWTATPLLFIIFWLTWYFDWTTWHLVCTRVYPVLSCVTEGTDRPRVTPSRAVTPKWKCKYFFRVNLQEHVGTTSRW